MPDSKFSGRQTSPLGCDDLDRLVEDDRGGRIAVVERRRIDEGLEGRAGLAQRLRRAVEGRLVEGEAADHGEDAAGIGVHRDEGAGDFRNLAQAELALLAFDRLDIDHVARRERLPQALAQEAGAVGIDHARLAVARKIAGFFARRLQADPRADVVDVEHHGEAPGRDVAERRNLPERLAPVGADVDLLDRAAIAVGLVEAHEAVGERLARHQLHFRVERGAHRQAALVELLVAVAVVQLAAHLFGEKAGGDRIGRERARIDRQRLGLGGVAVGLATHSRSRPCAR